MGALRFVTGMFQCLQATLGVGAYRVLPGRDLGVGVPSAQTTDTVHRSRREPLMVRGTLPSGRRLMPGSQGAQGRPLL